MYKTHTFIQSLAWLSGTLLYVMPYHALPCDATCRVCFSFLPLVHMNISLCVVCIYRNVYSFSFYWHFCRLSSYDICSFLSLSLSCRCLSFTLLSECMTGEKSKYIPNKEIIFIHIQRTRGPMMKHTMRFYVYVCELRAISRARERERVKKTAVEHCWLGKFIQKFVIYSCIVRVLLVLLLLYRCHPVFYFISKMEPFNGNFLSSFFIVILSYTHILDINCNV